MDADAIAGTVLEALASGGQIPPFSDRLEEFSEADAYAVTAALRRLRMKRGEKPVGRKIGFTNRGIWAEYGVYQPIWGDVYDTTCFDLDDEGRIKVSHLPEPRIEPEIILGLGGDLYPGMSKDEIVERIAWIAHGFEIVQSIFPGWRFGVADCIADGGLHGALHIGTRHHLQDMADRVDFLEALPDMKIDLRRDGEHLDSGIGANVLDGPIDALAHLVKVLANDTLNPPLSSGELVTTGTLTKAFPIHPGETWSTRLEGIALPGISITAE